MDCKDTFKPSRVLLSGPPGIGKTTICKHISELLKEKDFKFNGFYTEEIRGQNHSRIGFDIVSLKEFNKKLPLARAENVLEPQQFSSFRVGKYHVFIDKFEEVALPIFQSEENILLIDEIGKMELFSKKFYEEINKLLNSKDKVFVIATIPLLSKVQPKYLPFFNKLCEDKGSKLINVNYQNRNSLPQEILNIILMNVLIKN